MWVFKILYNVLIYIKGTFLEYVSIQFKYNKHFTYKPLTFEVCVFY